MVGGAADSTGHIARGQSGPRPNDFVTIAKGNLSTKLIHIVL